MGVRNSSSVGSSTPLLSLPKWAADPVKSICRMVPEEKAKAWNSWCRRGAWIKSRSSSTARVRPTSLNLAGSPGITRG